MLPSATVSTETPSPAAPERGDFIREIVAADVRAGPGPRGRHEVPARAQRLPPHRPREVDRPQLRHRARVRRPAATSGSTTRTRSRRSRSTSTRIQADIRWLGFDWGDNLFYASDYFETLYLWAVSLVERGNAYVDDQSGRRDPRDPRHAHRARHQLATTATGPSRRTSTCSRACARASSRRHAGAAGEDRHGQPEHQPPRPRPVPDRPRDPPADGRRLVHLPDVRLRARPVGRDRGRDPLDLHARVRGPSAALRLAGRAPPGAVDAPTSTSSPGSTSPTSSCRSGSCSGWCRAARPRLGRPPDADDLGHAPARLPGRGDPQLRDRGRRRQGQQRPRVRDARALDPGRAQPHGAAPVRGRSTRSRSSSRTAPRARSRR